jgi:hypothetical protein
MVFAMIKKQSDQVVAPLGGPDDGVVLLTLNEAAPRIAQTRAQILHLARIRDIDHVEVAGEFFFRPEALTEWVKRHEHKAWA